MRARRVILPIVLLMVWLLVHCGRRPATLSLETPMPSLELAPAATAITPTTTPRTIEELRARLAEVLKREGVPGGAFALIGPDGPIWVGGIGVRDRNTGVPVDGDTAFRVGSLSKTLIAFGVMRLVDQGKLDLDRPLREILPDVGIDNPWEAVAPVTLAQCLEHTAGLDDVRFNEIFTDDEGLPARDALAINPRSKRIRWRPGTRSAYSNVGYTLAGRAIEVASGMPFDVYLQREIFAPLGIREADFRRTPLLASRLATGHYDDDRTARFFPFAHRPAGSLLTSAADLGRLVEFWVRRGEGFPPIISRAAFARMERSGTLPYPRVDSDYGFANYGDVSYPTPARGHDGGMPGFHSSVRIFPELGVGYAMLLNSNYSYRGYREIRRLLFAYLTRDRTFAPPPTPTSHARVSSERPASPYYALGSPRNEFFAYLETVRTGWRITDAGSVVHVSELGGGSYDLVPTADGGYAYPGDHGSSVRFTTNVDGKPVMVTGYSYAEAAPWWLARLRFTVLHIAMLLLQLAPLWAIVILGMGVVERRRVLPPSLVVWPTIASLTCSVFPRCLEAAFLEGVIGIVHPITVAYCVLTVLFAFASVAALVCAIAWWRRPDRPGRIVLLFPTACAIAFTGLTIWLAANGMIGFRTWAY